MATIRLVPSPPSFFRTASLPLPRISCLLQSQAIETRLLVSSNSSSLGWSLNRGKRIFTLLALVNEESVIAENKSDEEGSGRQTKKQPKPCELYVCNLPRSHDIADLVEMFKPYGTVISVEVSKKPETGISRGCGFVTMGSIASAKNAIAALDGYDVDGRELRVQFSVAVTSGGRNAETQNSAPVKNLFYESPYKIYVGNIPWTTKPEDLRDEFSKFGTVVSARVLYDRKAGKNRAYSFLSFSSAKESDAALSLNGKDYQGRILVVRKGFDRED